MKAFKKPVAVQFKYLEEDMVVQTLEGPVPAGKGQVLMTGIRGEQYPIPVEYFEQHYTRDIYPGVCCKKKVEVEAEVLTVETSVKVSWCEALLTGKPGDYLVTYEPGNQAIVEKSIFEETYEILE